jgi:hypothetical protein
VPRAKLACGRVGVDGDGMVVQPGRLALRLLSGSVACMGCQLVCLHGAGNRSPTRRGGDVHALGSCRVVDGRLSYQSSYGFASGPFFPRVVNPRYRIHGTMGFNLVKQGKLPYNLRDHQENKSNLIY